MIAIKELRNILGLTQQAFADKLNLSKSTVESYEYGRREVPERTINDICRVFGISHEWLETGEGEMYSPVSRDEEIAAFVGSVAAIPDSFKARFISMLSKLDESEWELLEHMAELMANEKEQD